MRNQHQDGLIYEEVARNGRIFVYSVRLPGAIGSWEGRVGYRARTAPYSDASLNGNG